MIPESAPIERFDRRIVTQIEQPALLGFRARELKTPAASVCPASPGCRR
jgi:hypothetical protein